MKMMVHVNRFELKKGKKGYPWTIHTSKGCIPAKEVAIEAPSEAQCFPERKTNPNGQVMLPKDKRRGERRWRSFHAWMRRLQDDLWTHGSRLNPRGAYLHLKETGVCVIKRGDNWRDRYYCDCFDFKLQGSYRFKDTPHPKCYGIECHQRHFAHGEECLPIQERRELARAMGDEGPVDLGVRRRDPDRLVLVRKSCLCGYLMGKEWKRAQDVKWSDRRSDKKCPDCKRRMEERKRMPA